MNKSRGRSAVEGYSIQVLNINGDAENQLTQKTFNVENIGKGGFRFNSDIKLELEDRVQVLLHFPDEHTQEVLGRICYSEPLENGQTAYGFSIIKGFYSLKTSSAWIDAHSHKSA